MTKVASLALALAGAVFLGACAFSVSMHTLFLGTLVRIMMQAVSTS